MLCGKSHSRPIMSAAMTAHEWQKQHVIPRARLCPKVDGVAYQTMQSRRLHFKRSCAGKRDPSEPN
jgi:hypothetical protein